MNTRSTRSASTSRGDKFGARSGGSIGLPPLFRVLNLRDASLELRAKGYRADAPRLRSAGILRYNPTHACCTWSDQGRRNGARRAEI